MPTYNYGCIECGNEWEEIHKMNDPIIKECPKCKKETAKRLISNNTSFVLKGGGWYKEGYCSNKS